MTSCSSLPEQRPPIDKVGLCLIRDGFVLLARNRNATQFQIPGGKVEASDASDLDALIREIREELRVELDRASATYLGLFRDVAANDPSRLVGVKLYRGQVTGRIAPDNEIAELCWFDIRHGNAATTSPVVARQILPFLRTLA